MPTARKFADLWQRLGAQGSSSDAYGRLVELYLEPHRRYHTLDHIAHCLAELDEHLYLATEPDEVEAALWWHDAIYTPLRDGKPVTDNEERSAELCNEELRRGGVDEGRRSRIVSHILATKHSGTLEVGANVGLVLDVDLSILGQRRTVYDAYARGVEAEYRYDGTLSERDYLRGRINLFLLPALERGWLFHHDAFVMQYGTRARRNMDAELAHQVHRLDTIGI